MVLVVGAKVKWLKLDLFGWCFGDSKTYFEIESFVWKFTVLVGLKFELDGLSWFFCKCIFTFWLIVWGAM